MNSRKILICGAGIAGPTLAYWLLRYGFEPTLVERAPALRPGGYMIDFWGPGFDVAEKMGLLSALRADGYRFDNVRFVNRRGKVVGGFGGRALQSVVGERYLSILRSDLARIIYQSLGGRVKTIFADTVTGIDQRDSGIDVSFERSPPERFDLLIGAGGLHSPVRQMVFGSDDRYEKYLGYYAASFSIDGYPQRDPGVYVCYAVPGRQATRYSLRDDRTAFLFVFSRPTKLMVDYRDVLAQKQILRDEFGGDGWECSEILSGLGPSGDLYFDAVSQIRMNSWTQGRVALVGDACFSVSLLAGQGSSLAMAGAYFLAGELKKADGDYRLASANYEKSFWPFIARKQDAAQRFAGSFTPKSNFAIFVRNQVTRLMGLPFVAKLAMGPLVSDTIALPDYDAS